MLPKSQFRRVSPLQQEDDDSNYYNWSKKRPKHTTQNIYAWRWQRLDEDVTNSMEISFQVRSPLIPLVIFNMLTNIHFSAYYMILSTLSSSSGTLHEFVTFLELRRAILSKRGIRYYLTKYHHVNIPAGYWNCYKMHSTLTISDMMSIWREIGEFLQLTATTLKGLNAR